MPRGDRTGPLGQGSRTGRAAGFCAGYGAPGFVNPAPGFGYGFGRGRGAGYGRGRRGGFRGYGPGCFNPSWFYNWSNPYYNAVYGTAPGYGAYYGPAAPGPDPEEEKAYLLSEMKILQEQLSALEKRMAELKAEPNEA